MALAWLLDLSPVVVAIPGARRPETARSAARAATLALRDDDRDALASAFGTPRSATRADAARAGDADVVLVMGIPGAGKSLVAEEHVARGYLRLNRDERGGSLRELAAALDEELSSGARRVVLDNTYLTRAARSYVIETANRHGISTRCIWLDTPLAQAQLNLVERLLDRFGSLPTPEDVREAARSDPGVLAPTSQMRALRELEPPSADEGFASVVHVPFARGPSSARAAGVIVAAPVLREDGWKRALDDAARNQPHLVYDWIPAGAPDALDALAGELAKDVSGPVESAVCPHPAGPPICWCRPPLPGLALAFARAYDIDPSRSTLIGNAPAHRTLAATLGARYVAA